MNKNIKILVCYHKPAKIISNKYIIPIHVGREIAFENSKDGSINNEEYRWLEKKMIGDNTGDNISGLNRNYCELTALYWAWKNQESLGNPDYIGLMHYRRIIKLSDKENEMYSFRYIEKVCYENDVILTQKKKCFSAKNEYTSKNVYEHFCMEHGKRLTHILLECIKEDYPNMKDAMMKIMFSDKEISWYNIMIAKKEIFNNYCTWLFGILSNILHRCESENIDLSQSRMMGYYGEILLNIYFQNLLQDNSKIKFEWLEDYRLNDELPQIVISRNLFVQLKRRLREKKFYNDLKNLYYLLAFNLKRKRKQKTDCVDTLHSLTFRRFAPNGGSGGGSAVLSCQKILMGESYRHLQLTYDFFEDNYFCNKDDELWDLWAGTFFGYSKSVNERNTVYLTHDYGTAYGLFLAGKKYALVSHIQGARVEEKTNFGESMTNLSKRIIQYCEKKAMENAEFVSFPSYGAYVYLSKSKYTKVNFSKMKLGPILYNTLYASPVEQKIDKIPPKREFITILSIGQMTVAKGMDSTMNLIENILNKTSKKIRWIAVGQGPLLSSVIQKNAELMKKNKNYIFSHLGNCNYNEIQYLHRISDVYMMLQRISIFDLSTLEAMKNGSAVVLSKVGGNLEFNKENNIIFSDNEQKVIDFIMSDDVEKLGKLNKKVYEKYFSNECFIREYRDAFGQLVGLEGNSEKIYNSKLYDIETVMLEIKKYCEKEIKKAESYTVNYEELYRDWMLYRDLEDKWIYRTLFEDAAWKTINNKVWLIYLCDAIEKGNIYTANILANRYCETFGYIDLYKFLPAANFIVQNFNREDIPERVLKSAEIFKTFENNKNRFQHLIKNKTIAVVGNGPSEMGKFLGEEIDNHDIVIRFNNFSTKGFENDYGTKTNIWVRGSGASDVIDRDDITLFDLVVFQGDYWHLPLIPVGHPEGIYQYLSQKTPICYFDKKIHLSLLNEYDSEMPTTGLITIWALFQNRKIVKKIDVYGFAFRQENCNGVAEHYFNDRNDKVAKERSAPHDLNKESLIIKEVLKNWNE